METKFTKGKWMVNDDALTQVHGLQTSEVYIKGEWICYVRGSDTEQRKSNAKLIAAAPDLLNALLEITSAVVHGKFNKTEEIKNALNAIKKAIE